LSAHSDLAWLEDSVKEAVKLFWQKRDGGAGVLGGKTLHAFVKIIERVVAENGLPDAQIHTGKNSSQLPGYFRPHKSWDVVVTDGEKLVAAVEFKSQVGSIGNNFNNRTEEVLGSGIDLSTAIEESAFGLEANIFTGYLTLVEKSDESLATPKIGMNHFPVMHGFLLDESQRDKYVKNAKGVYPRFEGISYLHRYDVMCKRLMQKNLYKAAALLAVPNENPNTGNFESVSQETSIKIFMTKLAQHCYLSALLKQQGL
jgi:hypothetical protein